MKSWRWRELFCGTCHKCPRHCACVDRAPFDETDIGWTATKTLAKEFLNQ